MARFKNHWVLEIGRNVSLFFRVEVGIAGAGGTFAWIKERLGMKPTSVKQVARSATIETRDTQSGQGKPVLRRKLAEQDRNLKQARRQITGKDREIAELRAELTGKDTKVNGIKPENIAWIFGTARVGSTWLSRMMADLQSHTIWREPLVGELFGHLYYVRARDRRDKTLILGDDHRTSWLKLIRTFVLESAEARFPEAKNNYLVIKEPNGSIGAPLLMEALPESRMICLVRDPRDVAASLVDSYKEGSWGYERLKKRGDMEEGGASKVPDKYVRSAAARYLQEMGKSKEAYDFHKGPKVLVKYEDLRTNTLENMKRIYSDLGMIVDEEEIAKVVEKHSWENIPEAQKGEGKFFRKATPQGWREDLTPAQVKMIEETTAPLLKEFYPE